MDLWNLPEEPPENGEPVLLSIRGAKYPIIGQYRGDEYDGGNYYTLNSDTPLTRYGLHVTGWMSLPECVD